MLFLVVKETMCLTTHVQLVPTFMLPVQLALILPHPHALLVTRDSTFILILAQPAQPIALHAPTPLTATLAPQTTF